MTFRVSPSAMQMVSIFLVLCSLAVPFSSQVVINEGSNRNFATVTDEDGDTGDWIELYNAGLSSVDLLDYALTDDGTLQSSWVFSSYIIEPGEHLLVFCSGKDRQYNPPFEQVAFTTSFVPQTGWNTHVFDEAFVWDGVSDIVVNSCSYNSGNYTMNSVFNQSQMGYICSVAAFDNPEEICDQSFGETYQMRPNIQFNGIVVGNGTNNNGTTDYPAPYGNWWGCARNQSLYRAEELLAAGVTAGNIESLAWDVVSTPNVQYDYIDISLRSVETDVLGQTFIDNAGMYFHTDFKLDANGETVYLLAPDQSIEFALEVNCNSIEASIGSATDGAMDVTTLFPPSPGSTNNNSEAGLEILQAPAIALESGVYGSAQTTLITDPAEQDAVIRYTLNGDEPTESSLLYVGQELNIGESTSLRVRAFKTGYIPSAISSSSYLIGVSHTTPIVSLVIEDDFLLGDEGIFTNWWNDSERFVEVMYFDSSATHPLLFTRQAAIQVDGGAGGARSNPQTSFRLEMGKGSLGQEPVELGLLPNRPEREQFSRIYLRNGSNMWLSLPYKDGCQVEMMMGETMGYFSAARPASVYINGEYFGVYEMREKIDKEYFEVYDGNANNDIDLLSQANWYGPYLRAVEGDAQHYWESRQAFQNLDPFQLDFIDQADVYFDMDYLADYIIAETWMGNTDWPWNNIKLSRSEAAENRWRFSTIDLEICLWPWNWEPCDFNGLQYVMDLGVEEPFTGVWYQSVQNQQYRNYFINRYADILNTSYRIERLLAIENTYYERWLPEMLQEYERWVNPESVQAWHEAFINNHELFREDLICKSEAVREQVQSVFNLSGQVTVTLDVEPPGAGLIHINTITPQDLPWDGIYYHGVPVEIVAEAADGYQFLYWESNGEIVDLTDASWSGELNLEQIEFTAVFEMGVGVVNTQESQSELLISPNPARNHLSLSNDYSRIVSWEIRTVGNQRVESKVLGLSSRQVLVSVEQIPPGIYLMYLEYLDGHSDVRRFVKID